MTNLIYHNINAFPQQLNPSHRYEGRIGFWADVLEVNSANNSVTVVNDQGWEIPNIQVASKTWVVKEDQKDFSSSERCLPPKGSRVFILVPDGKNIASAFVLCSGYPLGENDVQDLWCQSDVSTDDGQKDMQKLNRIGEKVSQGGWRTKENYDTGNSKIESADGKISLELNPVEVKNEDTGEVEERQLVKLSVWDNEIEINPVDDQENKKQIQISLLGNTIRFSEDGIVLEDKNGCKVITSNTGIELYKDKDQTSKNYIKLGSTISMKGVNGTLEIS